MFKQSPFSYCWILTLWWPHSIEPVHFLIWCVISDQVVKVHDNFSCINSWKTCRWRQHTWRLQREHIRPRCLQNWCEVLNLQQAHKRSLFTEMRRIWTWLLKNITTAVPTILFDIPVHCWSADEAQNTTFVFKVHLHWLSMLTMLNILCECLWSFAMSSQARLSKRSCHQTRCRKWLKWHVNDLQSMLI